MNNVCFSFNKRLKPDKPRQKYHKNSDEQRHSNTFGIVIILREILFKEIE